VKRYIGLNLYRIYDITTQVRFVLRCSMITQTASAHLAIDARMSNGRMESLSICINAKNCRFNASV